MQRERQLLPVGNRPAPAESTTARGATLLVLLLVTDFSNLFEAHQLS